MVIRSKHRLPVIVLLSTINSLKIYYFSKVSLPNSSEILILSMGSG